MTKPTAEQFLAFARTDAQSRQWQTLKHGKPFSFTVDGAGLQLTNSNGNTRGISATDIQKFLQHYDDPTRSQELSKGFNNSYLFAILDAFTRQPPDFSFPEEIAAESNLREGATMQVTVNAYERSPEARRLCIEHHGLDCVVCGFNFERTYGERAAGFIHVHHLTPISLQGGERDVDPVRDLRPICPNCHAVVHLGRGCMSIEEARHLVCKHDPTASDSSERSSVPR